MIWNIFKTNLKIFQISIKNIMEKLKYYYKLCEILTQSLNTKRYVIDKYKTLKGQFIIKGYSVYRLIGVTADNFDCYYCLYDGKRLEFVNSSNHLTPLKGYILDEDYNNLVKLARHNHEDQVTYWLHKNQPKNIIKAYVDKHKNNLIRSIQDDETILCELCFDII